MIFVPGSITIAENEMAMTSRLRLTGLRYASLKESCWPSVFSQAMVSAISRYWRRTSGSEVSPQELTTARSSRASSWRSLAISHLGDSGTKRSTSMQAAEGAT